MRLIMMLSCLLLAAQGFAQCGPLENVVPRKLHSQQSVDLCQSYQNQVVLVVNTASQCGYTPQFKGLEALYQRYKEQGLVILGFPSDDFRQEFDTEKKTADVCYINYGVSFPMFATSAVKGSDANLLFRRLAAATTEPSWNFNKYLIGADGRILKHYPSRTTPEDPGLIADIEQALGK